MKRIKSIWNKPQYLINKILNHISIISIIFTLIAIILLVLRADNSLAILIKADTSFPDYYSNNISKLKNKIGKSVSIKEKYNYYKKLLNLLSMNSNLHKFYPLINESNTFMIDQLVTDGNAKKAEKLAFTWQKTYPYDFNAKFKYAEILKQTNPNKMMLYLQSLYQKHPDIELVISKYIDALLDDGEFKKALEVAIDASSDLILNTKPNFSILPKFKKNNNYLKNLSSQAILNKILQHPRWRFYYSKDLDFKIARSKLFTLQKVGGKYISEIEIPNILINNVKIDFPSYQNLNIGNLKIKINGIEISNLQVIKSHHLQPTLNDDVFVKGHKPYMVLKLNDDIIANNIHIEFSMGR